MQLQHNTANGHINGHWIAKTLSLGGVNNKTYWTVLFSFAWFACLRQCSSFLSLLWLRETRALKLFSLLVLLQEAELP